MLLPSRSHLQVYPKSANCVTACRDTSGMQANMGASTEMMPGIISFACKRLNSLAMRVTKRVAEEAGLREKDSVEIEVHERTFVTKAATTGLCPYALTRPPFLAYPWRSLQAHRDSSARSPISAVRRLGLRDASSIERSFPSLAAFSYPLNVSADPSDVLHMVEDGATGRHSSPHYRRAI
jgi:hypothetical protein